MSHTDHIKHFISPSGRHLAHLGKLCCLLTEGRILTLSHLVPINQLSARWSYAERRKRGEKNRLNWKASPPGAAGSLLPTQKDLSTGISPGCVLSLGLINILINYLTMREAGANKISAYGRECCGQQEWRKGVKWITPGFNIQTVEQGKEDWGAKSAL